MYKAIIVDDEASVRNGLHTHFDWNYHRIEVLDVFEDGLPALEFIKKTPVDIIVTDVRMNYMDGITLAKHALALYPQVKIVFISGYADIDYLKDALRMEAVDYILKSIDINELSEVITRVVDMLDKTRNQKAKILDMEMKLSQSMPLLRLRQLSELMSPSEDTEEDLYKSVCFLGIPLDSKTRYAVLIMRLLPKSKRQVMNDKTEKERLAFSILIEDSFKSLLSQYGAAVVFKLRISEYIAIMNLERDEYEEELISAAEKLHIHMKTELHLDTTVGISEPFIGLKQMRAAYENACEAISKNYLVGKDIPISIKKYEDYSYKALCETAEKEIIDSILSGDVHLVQESLSKIMVAVRGIENKDEQQNFMIFLLLLPTKLMSSMRPENMGPYKSQANLITGLLQCQGINEQEAMLNSVYDDITEYMVSLSTPHSTTVIKRIREIIELQYMEQLSVTSLAEQVNLTSTYLCVLFKQSTGKTINEYLTQVRINKAKEYLTHTNITLLCYTNQRLTQTIQLNVSKLNKMICCIVYGSINNITIG